MDLSIILAVATGITIGIGIGGFAVAYYMKHLTDDENRVEL